MAAVDELLERVPDETLRALLKREVHNLRKTRNFGLVFEEHRPEWVATPSLKPQVGGLALDPDGKFVRVQNLHSGRQ